MSREPDITAVMITVDRSPKRNYLRQTIDNLTRSGVFTSERLSSFTLFIGQPIESTSREYQSVFTDTEVIAVTAIRPYLPCENAGRALLVGSKLASHHPNGWVLFLEDDIDVCDDFLGSVGRWLNRYSPEADPHNISALYSFGCAYPQVSYAGGDIWRYHPFTFYGTQAIALRPQFAQAIGTFISSNPQIEHHATTEENRLADRAGQCLLAPSEYDLMISHWAAVNHHNISASIPSFVQHIGQESSLSDRPFCHTFPSWPGREWSYG